MPAELSVAEPRPLTSREISKVVTAMLTGIANAQRSEADKFGPALDFLIATNKLMTTGEWDGRLKELGELARDAEIAIPGKATWFSALVATVGGFYGWCERVDVDTAILWVAENLPRMGLSGPSDSFS